MSTYRTLKGYNIKSVTSDPSNTKEGQIWYNDTSNKIRVNTIKPAAWASGGNLGTARFSMNQGAGTQTAALAFALRDIVTDLAGYIFVVIRRPFQISDRIQIGDTKGDVLQIEWFQITLLEVGNWVDNDQSTGRLVYMPIGQVLTQTIFNYSAGFDWIWNEISVLMTFESDWEKAKKIILTIINKQDEQMNQNVEKKLKKAMQQHMIEYPNIKPIIYTNTTESGINLTVRYLCPPKQRRISEHEFWEALLKKFGNNPSLSLAYPTSRYIDT